MIYNTLILFILLFFDKNIHIHSTPPHMCKFKGFSDFIALYLCRYSLLSSYFLKLFYFSQYVVLIKFIPLYIVPTTKTPFPSKKKCRTNRFTSRYSIVSSCLILHYHISCCFISRCLILFILFCRLLRRAYNLLAIFVYLTYLHFTGFTRINFIHKTKKRRSEVEGLE